MGIPSGRLIIKNNGKLALGGEVFDEHGTYPFEAYIDTGATFGIILQRGLADAVCAPVDGATGPISIGAGGGTIGGHMRRVNFRFGGLEIRNYPAVVLDKETNRNLVGVKFFQDAGVLLLVDFHEGKTKGGFVTSDRKFARTFGKAGHCLTAHGLDLTKSAEPCPVCGMSGEK